ncbi:hypothetical protein CHH26_11345 [Qipengyuania flava]|uniref:hypothetical protein n=1 Tax=Qipengyuania flava TaxID=192812 RepID=UPI000B8BED25|nr:hypothetical protein [Qipengyuania flava]ASP30754.1 hypothetical protein CHH26_11345 [Qipengyuania flava]
MSDKSEAERIIEASDRELLIMRALDATYQRGDMQYLHYSAARDVTEARYAALGWYANYLKGDHHKEDSEHG